MARQRLGVRRQAEHDAAFGWDVHNRRKDRTRGQFQSRVTATAVQDGKHLGERRRLARSVRRPRRMQRGLPRDIANGDRDGRAPHSEFRIGNVLLSWIHFGMDDNGKRRLNLQRAHF